MVVSSSDELKTQVKTYWETNPCGIRETDPDFDESYFTAITQQRYTTHPYIPEFAEFERWQGKRVLEIGVGAGTDFCRWAEAGAKAVGVDLTTQGVRITRRRLQLSKLAADVYLADCEHLPFDDHTFDLCYSFGVLHHTPDTARAIGEIFRVLKPGGQIRIMLYHTMSWVSLQVYVFYGLLAWRPFTPIDTLLAAYMESPGTKAYTIREARALLSSFTNIRIRPTLTCYDTWVGIRRVSTRCFRWRKRSSPLG